MNAPRQQDISLEELNQQVWQHVTARDWHKNPSRSLAISLVLEASELLEHYQWSEASTGSTEDVGDELADVLIYAMQIAQRNNIDIAHHIQRKLEKSNKKYPPEAFKDKSETEKHEAWISGHFAKDTES